MVVIGCGAEGGGRSREPSECVKDAWGTREALFWGWQASWTMFLKPM